MSDSCSHKHDGGFHVHWGGIEWMNYSGWMIVFDMFTWMRNNHEVYIPRLCALLLSWHVSRKGWGSHPPGGDMPEASLSLTLSLLPARRSTKHSEEPGSVQNALAPCEFQEQNCMFLVQNLRRCRITLFFVQDAYVWCRNHQRSWFPYTCPQCVRFTYIFNSKR